MQSFAPMPKMNFPDMNQNNLLNNKTLSINDFTIIEQLGKGAHGAVYKVKYKLTGKIFALKLIEQSHFIIQKSPSNEYQENQKEIDYLREKTILYDLTKRNCENIVKLYGDFEDNKYRYLLMECTEGIKLENLRGKDNPNGYVAEKLVIHILTQLLKTLQFLHDTCKIIHRDIKPDNIIIDSNNNIKLLDFGLAAYLVNNNNKLVSKRSFKGAKRFAPDEIIMFGEPRDYDYKVDIFSLGFTIYSLMNPSNNDYYNLPKETEIVNGNFQRYELPLLNKFYSTWLIEFVQLLYETDQKKRPTASEALGLLLGFQNNPQVVQTYIQLKSKKNNNFVNNYNIIWRRQNNINNNSLPNIPNYRMSNSFDQINPNAMNISPNINFARSNTVEIGQKKNNVQEFLQPNQGKENRILSSMKSLLQVFYRIDLIKFIKVQFFSLFSNCQLNYSQFYLYSFNDMLDKIGLLDSGKINQINYTILVNDFIKKTFINNTGEISGTRPIILYYMIASIFNTEFKKYFDNTYGNYIFDKVIQNNFLDYNKILPMNVPQVYNEIKEAIFEFKNNYKGFLVERFYFLILKVYSCAQCNCFLETKTQIAPFLQLDVPNPINNISQLINEYFRQKIKIENNFTCSNCKFQAKKFRKIYCLNLPEYLILEFEDKNKVNFNDNVILPLYDGTKFSYQYLAGIYKYKANNISNFIAVIKNGNNYFLCNNDIIWPCPQNNINLECPSLAVYKKIL